MGILATTSNYQKCIKKKLWIDKTCEKFVKILDQEGEVFNTPQAKKVMYYFNKFLRAQEIEYLNDISELYFKEKDVRFIESLELQLHDYMDLFYDENDYPGLKEFYESFSKFKDKIKIEEMSFSDFKESLKYLDSDDDFFLL